YECYVDERPRDVGGFPRFCDRDGALGGATRRRGRAACGRRPAAAHGGAAAERGPARDAALSFARRFREGRAPPAAANARRVRVGGGPAPDPPAAPPRARAP